MLFSSHAGVVDIYRLLQIPPGLRRHHRCQEELRPHRLHRTASGRSAHETRGPRGALTLDPDRRDRVQAAPGVCRRRPALHMCTEDHGQVHVFDVCGGAMNFRFSWLEELCFAKVITATTV